MNTKCLKKTPAKVPSLLPGKPVEQEVTSAPAKEREEMAGTSHRSPAAELVHAHLHLGSSDVTELQEIINQEESE